MKRPAPLTIHKTVPAVTDRYSKTTGALIEQSTTVEGKTKTITSVYNTLGELEKYTDANSGTTKYTYETGGDGRLDEVTYEIGKEKFAQPYAYNATTGVMGRLYDSGLKKYFTATYDIEGKMLTDTYPDNLTAHYAYNQLGTAIESSTKRMRTVRVNALKSGLKTTSSRRSTAKHEQTSTLAKENYTYDKMGSLAESKKS